MSRGGVVAARCVPSPAVAKLGPRLYPAWAVRQDDLCPATTSPGLLSCRVQGSEDDPLRVPGRQMGTGTALL